MDMAFCSTYVYVVIRCFRSLIGQKCVGGGGIRPEPRYNELTAIPRPPIAGQRRERVEERMEGDKRETIEGWETHRERRTREQGKGKGGRGGEEKGRGVPRDARRNILL